MNAIFSEHDFMQSLAEKYTADGYSVEIEPYPNRVPFDLSGYRPDMLATKGDLNLIIEVKNKIQRGSIERLQTVAQSVSQHQGWHFLVVTPDDIENNPLPDGTVNYATWAELSKQVKQAPLIIDAIGNSASLIYIWGLIEAVLRRRVIDLSMPIEKFPFTRIAKHLYSEGELSMEELDLLLTMQNHRNKVAHGYKAEVNRDELSQLIKFIETALLNWMHD
jgi:hypothetical protein